MHSLLASTHPPRCCCCCSCCHGINGKLVVIFRMLSHELGTRGCMWVCVWICVSTWPGTLVRFRSNQFVKLNFTEIFHEANFSRNSRRSRSHAPTRRTHPMQPASQPASLGGGTFWEVNIILFRTSFMASEVCGRKYGNTCKNYYIREIDNGENVSFRGGEGHIGDEETWSCRSHAWEFRTM